MLDFTSVTCIALLFILAKECGCRVVHFHVVNYCFTVLTHLWKYCRYLNFIIEFIFKTYIQICKCELTVQGVSKKGNHM